MAKIDCNVIVCGPAIGKTYLAKTDKRFIDLDGIKADYKYNLGNMSTIEKESGKLNRGSIVHHDSTKYAIQILQEKINQDYIILLTYKGGLLKYVMDNKISYCLVYADKDLCTEYANRMKNRGNSSPFIEEMTNEEAWNQFYLNNEMDQNPSYKVKLKKGQYLSDIKNLFVN
ncbi:MAG: hypothetical protein PHN72_02255 [Bacilli bacterium]|nr:hypothetical protein [Bacilli bacterium]